MWWWCLNTRLQQYFTSRDNNPQHKVSFLLHVHSKDKKYTLSRFEKFQSLDQGDKWFEWEIEEANFVHWEQLLLNIRGGLQHQLSATWKAVLRSLPRHFNPYSHLEHVTLNNSHNGTVRQWLTKDSHLDSCDCNNQWLNSHLGSCDPSRVTWWLGSK